MIYPEQKTVVAFSLGKEGTYGRPDIYCETDSIQVELFNSFGIDLSEIFQDY
ncbi:hypothetical protein DSBG_4123 [Desulfosporosinus sp. BG]|nr:hypothetical protein [Desulfosporosinus sp. BG]ODA39112.1 hypothetical protein DSBG_4123 [Desulfosporosinus sp. BG]